MDTVQADAAVCDFQTPNRSGPLQRLILRSVVVLGVAVFCTIGIAQEPAQEPAREATPPTLAVRIDQLLALETDQLTAPKAEPGALLRRLSLDLRGVVPTGEELEAFLADQASDTRPEHWSAHWSVWVGRFLADPLCDEHLVSFLDRTLMLRRPNTQVDRAAWLQYLREQVAADVPLDVIAKQLLYSPWWNREHRPAQKFFLDRSGDPNLVARDIGRVFLGRDMQCAQCHDHPIVDDFKQTDYHGLLAYVSTSSLVETTYKDAEGKDQKVKLYVEGTAGDAPFESVFDKGVPFRSGPRMIGQTEQFEEYLMPDARYATEAKTDAMAGVALPPKISRRQALAEQLASRTNRDFVANWANRFWSLVVGQGLVQPLDMHHPHNPASHPALFDLISAGLLEADLRPRKFLEQLVLSEAYQRGGRSPITSVDAATVSSASTEQLAAIRASATAKIAEISVQKTAAIAKEAQLQIGYETMLAAWRKIQGERAAIRTELDATEAAFLAAKKKSADAAAAYAAAQKRQTDTQSRISLLDDSAIKIQQAADLAGGDDAELKQAIAVTKQRADAARATVTEVDKSANDTKAASDATMPELATTTAKVQEVVGKLQPVHQSLSAADAATIAARNDWSLACRTLKNCEQKVTNQERVVAWLDGTDTAIRLAGEARIASQASAAIESDLPKSDEFLVAAMTQLSAAQSAEQAAVTALDTASAAVDRHTSVISQLQQSLDSLAVSVKLVSTTEPFAAAQAVMQTEVEARRVELGALQAAVENAKQLAAAATLLTTARTQELTVKQAEKKSIEERIALAKADVTKKEADLASAITVVSQSWIAVQKEATQNMALAAMQPLTPEQLCWSTLRVTGILDAYIRTEAVELEKQSPMPADADASAKATRHRQSVRGAYDKLRGNEDVYVSLFASGPDKTEDDFFASADQALYTANAGSVFAWAGPGNNNVTQAAIGLSDNTEIAKLIYWTLLCRNPAAEEVQLVSEQIASSGENRNAVIQEIVWSLLASAEFRFVN